MKCNRRNFLKMSATALLVNTLPISALATTVKSTDVKRTLSFYNTHTLETLTVCYFDQEGYRLGALAEINHILRDHRTNEIQPIDLNLLDQLFAIKVRIRPRTPFHIISGYRSEATNALLRQTTSGVAKASYHTKGQAIDIRLPEHSTLRLRDLCLKFKAGGVGYYPRSNFVHLDTGQYRTW